MIKVHVKLLSVLSKKVPISARGRIDLELPEGSTIADVIRELDIKLEVHCSLNGEITRDKSRILKDGDEMSLFRPIGGG